MSNVFFTDGDYNPQPKDQIRIEALEAIPYPDRQRIFIKVQVTHFQERPNLLLLVHNADDRLVGELNIIATMHAEMEFTMHLRGIDDPTGTYTVTAELFYETRNPPQDTAVEGFVISAEGEE